MPHLHCAVAPEVFTQHPGDLRGVLVFDQLNNSTAAPSLQPLLRQAESTARSAVPGNVAEFPPVAAWRDAYRRFGAKPSEHRSAIEAGTRCVFVNIDGLPPISRSAAAAAMQQVQALVAEHCGGRLCGSAVLSAEQPQLNVEFDA